MRHRAKFCANQSNGSRDMAVFRFFMNEETKLIKQSPIKWSTSLKLISDATHSTVLGM